jgi:hypothetical protein
MKKIFMTVAVCCLMSSCGNSDKPHNDSKQTENYPTYDTTNKPDHINDSVSKGGMRSGGDLRHNVDANNNGQ